VAKDKIFKNKANAYRQSFKVYDVDGKALSGSDYDGKNAVYEEVTLKEDGTVDSVVRTLDKTSTVSAGNYIRITVEGKGVYAGGNASGIYRILTDGHDISKAKIQLNAQNYTGSPILIEKDSQFNMEKTYVKNGKDTLELHIEKYIDKDGVEQLPNMEVVPGSYVKNVNKGTAKVTLRGINGFGGEKTVTFKIVQRNVVTNWWTELLNNAKVIFN